MKWEEMNDYFCQSNNRDLNKTIDVSLMNSSDSWNCNRGWDFFNSWNTHKYALAIAIPQILSHTSYLLQFHSLTPESHLVIDNNDFESHPQTHHNNETEPQESHSFSLPLGRVWNSRVPDRCHMNTQNLLMSLLLRDDIHQTCDRILPNFRAFIESPLCQ